MRIHMRSMYLMYSILILITLCHICIELISYMDMIVLAIMTFLPSLFLLFLVGELAEMVFVFKSNVFAVIWFSLFLWGKWVNVGSYSKCLDSVWCFVERGGVKWRVLACLVCYVGSYYGILGSSYYRGLLCVVMVMLRLYGW
jgi:hypothetical protein